MMKGYNVKDPEQLVALLLHFGGEELFDIYEAFTENDKKATDQQDVFQKAVTLLTNYFTPKQNIEYQRYEFRHSNQLAGENLEQFTARLRTLAATCEFTEVQREIKSQIISGCLSQKLRRKGLSEPSWNMEKLLEVGKALELSEIQALDIERCTESVSAVQERPRPRPNQGRARPIAEAQRETQRNRKCYACNGNFPHSGKCPAIGQECENCGYIGHFALSKRCPATGKVCKQCNKMNHFMRKCRSVQVKKSDNVRTVASSHEEQEVYDESDEIADYVWMVSEVNTSESNEPRPMFPVTINGVKMNILADSGSTINLLNEADFVKIPDAPKLMPHDIPVYPHSSPAMDIKGKFVATICSSRATRKATVIVCGGDDKSLLSWGLSRQLRLIDVVHAVDDDKDVASLEVRQLKAKYKDIFTGLGKLKDVKVKLHIDSEVKPVVQNHRRVPFHVRKDIEQQLQKDMDRGVIETPTGPTPWVSPIVVVPRKTPGNVRVCVDMRAANKAIKRERHSTPTLTEMVNQLNGAQVFSKIDLNQGYNQIELDEESREITTFATHVGLRRYTRLNFGMNSAAEIFQEEIRKALSGLNGVVNVSDDILCFGRDKAEHLRNLANLFQRIQEKGLTLNESKCEFEKDNIVFFGHKFSAAGLSADPHKISAIVNMSPPTNASEVRSLLGMMNYCGQRFVRDYATLTHELRELTKKDVTWTWTERHQEAFERLKEALITAPTLAYFNQKQETEIYVDASPFGVSAILMQKDKNSGERYNVHFASRALTSTEQRYSQLERESLAIVYACETLHIYLYGANFKVFTDHKPLLSLFNSTRSRLSARMQGWALRLQPYTFELLYMPGSSNPADYLSRHVNHTKQPANSREQKFAEHLVNYLSTTSAPKPLPLYEIQKATCEDATLQAVMKALESGNWHVHGKGAGVYLPAYERLKRLSAELAVSPDRDLLLRDTRIVIPQSLQKKAVELAHLGHQGLVKTKTLLREKIWFYGIDSMVETLMKDCILCQIATQMPTKEPAKMSPLPVAPWVELSMDFGQLANGKHLLVLIDDYSRYPFVEIIDSVSARTVIPKLDHILAMRGIPQVIRSDNGPPFNGEEFRQYALRTGFRHRKITPLWPCANAEVERFMRTVKKSVNAAIRLGTDWCQELRDFLLAYRATPHSTTKASPATLLFRGPIRTKLPQLTVVQDDQNVRNQDHQAKMKMKHYHDRKSYIKQSNLEEGDWVLVKNTSLKKSTPYQPTPLQVIAKNGSMVTATAAGAKVTRNTSFFKKVPRRRSGLDSDDEFSGYEEPIITRASGAQMSQVVVAPENMLPQQVDTDHNVPNYEYENIVPEDNYEDTNVDVPTDIRMHTEVPVNVEPVTVLRRSARTRKVPERLKDYVKYNISVFFKQKSKTCTLH